MPFFSPQSYNQLSTCHPDLQILFNEVIKYVDCKVIEGHRGQEAQDKAYADGKSKLKWPNGNHNKTPSDAVDVYPWPIQINNTKRFYYFAGFVMGIAAKLKAEGKIKHDIRYGGDWDRDYDPSDQQFVDLVHFEVVP